MFSRLHAIAGRGSNHPANSAKVESKTGKTVVVKKDVTKEIKPARPPPPQKVQPAPEPSPAKTSSIKPAPAKRSSPARQTPEPEKKKARRARPVARRVFVGPSDDSDSEDEWDKNIQKLSNSTPGLSSPATEDEAAQRKSRKGKLLLRNVDGGEEKIIDMADIASRREYKGIFDKEGTEFMLELPFGKERYVTRAPVKAEDLSPMAELDNVLTQVAASFVPREFANEIRDPMMRDCILRRIRRAVRAGDGESFLRHVGEYNSLIQKLRDNGSIAARIAELDDLPPPFIYEILNEVYARTVSPRAQELRNYEAFSNNVYGELLPSFMTRIFRHTGLDCDGVFVDLGSGVGNCVLQAALEVGCESWGCEIMSTASELAKLQHREFVARTKLWGIRTGDAHIVSADFVKDPDVQGALRRADVVLCNNYAFDPALNARLVDMFLDLKDGCKVVSLKSFVPAGHAISEHNRESPLNILEVEHLTFPTSSVSWTIAGGDFYVSTVNRSRLSKAVSA